MSSVGVNIIQLHPPPATLTKYPGAKYWRSPKGKDYFLFPTGGGDGLGILAYDFNKDRWMDWCDYPDEVEPINCISTIDHLNNKLYISHGDEPLLIILDIEKKEWNIIITENDDTYNPYKDERFLKGIGRGRLLPNGEFHILVTTNLHNQHLRYNHLQEKFEKISQLSINNNCYLGAICLCYIIEKNYLLQFGGIINNKPTKKIYFTNLSKYNKPIKRMIKKTIAEEENDLDDDIKSEQVLEDWKGDNFVWKEHPTLKLPFAAKSIKVAYMVRYKVIVVFLRRKSGKGASYILDTGLFIYIFQKNVFQ